MTFDGASSEQVIVFQQAQVVGMMFALMKNCVRWGAKLIHKQGAGMKTKILGLLAVALLAGPMAANAVIYASNLVAASNTTAFGSGVVTGAPDGGGLWLGSTFDPPAALGSFTVGFGTALADGAGTDLTILDIGSSANETFSVEVSSDNLLYTLLGTYSAVNNVVDFAGLFSGPVSFVRLTNTSSIASADIDALWGNYAASVPEPGTLALLGLGLLGLGMSRRKV